MIYLHLKIQRLSLKHLSIKEITTTSSTTTKKLPSPQEPYNLKEHYKNAVTKRFWRETVIQDLYFNLRLRIGFNIYYLFSIKG